MLFDRLKNIVRSNLSDLYDKVSEGDLFDTDQPIKETRKTSYSQQDIDKEFERMFKNKEPEVPQTPPEERIHYRTLELPVGANYESIKTQYKKLMKLHHPDRFPNDPKRREQAEHKTKSVNEAYSYFKRKFEKA